MSMTSNSNKPIIDISIIGVGDAGNLAIHSIPKDRFKQVKFFYANTNWESLAKYDKDSLIFLENNSDSKKNGDPIVGKLAANNSINEIKSKISNSQLLILTAGFGGGTGTGALPIISKIAREMGIITIAVITTPFSYEGSSKELVAREGISELKKNVDSLIIVSNNKLINNYPDIAAIDAFRLTNNILKNCVKTFIDLISLDSIINLSIADLISTIKDKGEAYIGFGKGVGRNKITRAVNGVLESKIIETSIKNATNAVLNIVGDTSVTMQQINEIINLLKAKSSNPKLNIVFSFNVDKNLRNEVQLSLIATFDNNSKSNNSAKTNEEKLIQNSQEILLKIGNTLENELSGYTTGEFDLPNFEIEKSNYQSDDKDQDDFIISSEKSEEDDDIPFFLK